ncbi:MAG: zinc ABC transporter substrate-binding protein [Clostridiales Family XIII bacterium]|jgi:zinc transport system substrate-binding protein|nr:zinc ABC transporter substrate-binding protein [Clostridiales Family XIII bacterium]
MKKIWCILSIGCALLFLFAACGAKESSDAGGNGNETQDGRLSVYASFYPMYDFTVKIGGDKVSVTNMVPAGTEPHDWEPAAADLAGLEAADVFICNGAGMEHWAEDILDVLQNKDLIVAEASAGISLLEGRDEHGDEEEAAEEEEHEDEGYDPHVWLDPLNAKRETENIKNALVSADPDNAAYYEANYEKYAAELDALDAAFREALSPLPNKDIIVAHEAFGYLCAAYGLKQVPIEGLSPDSEPDPAKMAEIIDFAQEHALKVIFFEELVSPKVAEAVAEAVGAETKVLSPIEGLSDEDLAAGGDYFSVMHQNLEALKLALQ